MPVLLTELLQTKKPVLEPIAFEDAATYLHSTKGEESLVRLLLPASRQLFESKLGIALLTQQFRATFEFAYSYEGVQQPSWYFDPDERVATIPRPPLQSYDLVEFEVYYDTFNVMDSSDWTAISQFPAQIRLYTGIFATTISPWWIGFGRKPRMRVTYTCGYPTVDAIPDRYRLMLLQLLAYHYLEREVGGIPATMSEDFLGEKIIIL
jgi:hypothetical protein